MRRPAAAQAGGLLRLLLLRHSPVPPGATGRGPLLRHRAAPRLTEKTDERPMRDHCQACRRCAHEPVRALADPVGRPVHRCRDRSGPALSGPLPAPRAPGGGPGQPAGGGAHLDHDHPDAHEDRLRRPAPGALPLEGDRGDPVRQLGRQALLHGAARLDLHPRGLRPLAAGGAAR